MPDKVGVVLVKGWIVLVKISLLPDNQISFPVKIHLLLDNEKPRLTEWHFAQAKSTFVFRSRSRTALPYKPLNLVRGEVKTVTA